MELIKLGPFNVPENIDFVWPEENYYYISYTEW